MESAPQRGRSALLALATVAGIAFLVWELRVPHPLVNIRVLTVGPFAAAACVAVVFGIGQFGTTFLIPLFVQTIQGLTPLDAGLLLMPGALLLGLFMPVGGYLCDRLPPRALLITGLSAFALSTYWLHAVDVNTAYWLILVSVVVSRLGQALINPTLNATAMRSLQTTQLRQGAGMINFFRQLGGAFGDAQLEFFSMTFDLFFEPALFIRQTLLLRSSADDAKQHVFSDRFRDEIVSARAHDLR